MFIFAIPVFLIFKKYCDSNSGWVLNCLHAADTPPLSYNLIFFFIIIADQINDWEQKMDGGAGVLTVKENLLLVFCGPLKTFYALPMVTRTTN